MILTIAMATSVACGGADSAPGIEANRSDEDGLIRYGMPEGWTNTRISSANHYTRADMPEDPTILQVTPRNYHPAAPIEQFQEGTRGKHEIQGHAIVRESTKVKNGFTVWEAVYEAHARGDDLIFHDFFLFADGLLVEVNLGTRKEDYDNYVGDLLAVVDSVRQANPRK
jgi:hypothetical protein